MKRTLNQYWIAFKAAFPFIVTLWVMGLITYVTVKIFNPSIDIDIQIVSVIGMIFTLVTIPIHNWFKNRK